MTIYLDKDFKCHALAADGRRAVVSTFFDGKCDAFLCGYRYVPAGERWIRSDGTVFCGEMIAPWQDANMLEAAQRAYEQQLLGEYTRLIDELYEEAVT